MTYLLGVLAFVVALLVSVMLHEAGHFVAAKRFGMKATQFMVGFGPTLWSRKRGETEYGIKGIPLGGYVRIVGYTPLEEIEPGDEERAFFRRPAGHRAAVIAGGVAMNFIVAFVLLVSVAMTLGQRQSGTATTAVAAVSPCVPASLSATCLPGDTVQSPAARAGLRAGDRIISFAGIQVRTWDGLRAAIKSQPPGATVAVGVLRGGRPLELRITLASVGGSAYVGMTSRVAGGGYRRLGPLDAVTFAGRSIGQYVKGVGQALADLPASVPDLFSANRAKTPGGQVGSVVGATEVSGQIFSAPVGWQDKTYAYLQLVISVNIFLGALNVLPLLPLDGGHLAVLAYERTRARVNRWRGRPDPGTVDMAKLLPVTYLVFMVLIGLGVLLILADVFNPLTIPQ